MVTTHHSCSRIKQPHGCKVTELIMVDKRERKDQQNTGFWDRIVSWNNLRALLAKTPAYTILFIGSFVSCTGGFTALPYLLNQIVTICHFIPYITLLLHPYLMPIACAFAAVSGFSFFWSAYHKPLLDFCFKRVDWGKYFVLGFFNKFVFSKENRLSNPKPSQSNESSDDFAQKKSTFNVEYGRASEALESIKILIETLPHTLKTHLQDKYSQELYDKTQGFGEQLSNIHKQDDTSDSKSIKPLPTWKSLISQMAILLVFITVAIGPLVGIGMGALTTEKFLTTDLPLLFAKFLPILESAVPTISTTLSFIVHTLVPFIIPACLIAAFCKQAPQVVFNGENQFKTLKGMTYSILSLFIGPVNNQPSEDDQLDLEQKLSFLKSKIDRVGAIKARINKIEQEITAYINEYSEVNARRAAEAEQQARAAQQHTDFIYSAPAELVTMLRDSYREKDASFQQANATKEQLIQEIDFTAAAALTLTM